MKNFLKNWIPVLVWAGIIFILSSIPNLESGLKQDFILRKIAHILEYAILTFLLYRALRPEADQFKPGKKEKRAFAKALILAIIIAFLYALSDEYHQTFVFGREGKLGDVGIDSIGILLVGLVWYYKNICPVVKLRQLPGSKK